MCRGRVRRRKQKKNNRRLFTFAALAALAVMSVVSLLCAQASEAPRAPGIPRRKAGEESFAGTGTDAPEASLVSRREEPSARMEAAVLDVPFISQLEDWPTGCESVCAVMALQYAGIDVTVDDFIDNYLPMGSAPYENEEGVLVGCDPRKAFPGDPRSQDGWGCYAPVIQTSLERLLEAQGEDSLSVLDLSGEDLDVLCEKYVDRGIPVLVWATIGMEEPWTANTFYLEETGEEFQWVYPMHCLLLIGWDEEGYYFNDPMEGKKKFYLREDVQRAYKGLGKQALAIS